MIYNPIGMFNIPVSYFLMIDNIGQKEILFCFAIFL